MNTKKIGICAFLILFVTALSFADPLFFTNESREPLENKTKQHVSDYQKLKLTRETANKLSDFIKTSFKLTEEQKNSGNIENIIIVLSQVKTEEKEIFSEDNIGFVEMKLNLEVDTDNVKYYLNKMSNTPSISKNKKSKKGNKNKKVTKIDKDKKIEKEFEEIVKDRKELEDNLKKATKVEYENQLAYYTKNKFAEYEYKEKEYNDIAFKELNKTQVKLQNDKKAEDVVSQSETKNEDIEAKISKETDIVEKAKLENKALINKLNNEAKDIVSSWKSTDGITKEKLLIEVKKIKQDTYETLYKLSNMLNTNKTNLENAYDAKIAELKANSFSQTKPIKDQWETTDDYNKRLDEYEKNQKDFIEKANNDLQDLKAKKEEDIFKDEVENLQALVSISKPFADKLTKFQEGTTYNGMNSNAKLISLGEVNADEQYFIMNVEYLSKNYVLKFDFRDLGIEKAKEIYQEKDQFVIEPLFSIMESDVVGELVFRLTGFNVKHNTKYVKKFIALENALIPFKEIVEFKNYEKKLLGVSKKKDELVNLNAILKKTLKKFEENENLKKFSVIIDELKRVNEMTDFEKIEKLDDYKTFIEGVKNLDNIVISLSVSTYYTVGLKNNGTVVAVGENQFGQCDVKEWNNVTSVAAGEVHTLGLQKNGRVLFVGDSTGKANINSWDTIVDIGACDGSSAGVTKDGIVMFFGDTTQQALVTNLRNVSTIALSGKPGKINIVALKKDGKVEYIGNDNSFGLSGINNWENIDKIALGINHIAGLKKDGTVVAIGKNKESQCNVSEWKDIVDVTVGNGFTIGLKRDGTIECTEHMGKYNFSDWKDIAIVEAGDNYIIGIKKDGNIVSTGYKLDLQQQNLQQDVEKWSINFQPMK